ncbi:hypothetical protein niasHS_011082 [Heterodera schachtii]|uniref:Transcription factor Iwr1 domain-containing protein n=1 Tax=Heterodera schachtii TaxID=97005 RepID=A0ABD2J108_HETSC
MNIPPKSFNLAPIAEQEGCDLDQSVSSSSFTNHQQIGHARRAHPRGMPRMIRLRRKRRDDPFGTLIQSTKKMRLNDQWNSSEGQASGVEGTTTIAKNFAMIGERAPSGSHNISEMDGVLFTEDEEDELLFYYGGQDEGDDSDADGYDDESDSNAEEYYKNDYPDEENGKFISFADGVRTNEYENDSTSGDDNFDHYGDEATKYGHFCYEDDKEGDEDPFSFGKMISAQKKGSEDDSD